MSLRTVSFIDGVAEVSCGGGHWFLMYDGTEITFYGLHTGQITTGNANIVLEYFDLEQEMLDRITELGLEIPE